MTPDNPPAALPEKTSSSSDQASDTSQGKDSIQPEIDKALNQLPPDIKHQVQTSFTMMGMMGMQMNPLLHKLTPQHIDKILDLASDDNKLNHSDKRHSRWIAVGTVAGVLVFILTVIYICFTYNHPEMVRDVLSTIGFILGGIGIAQLLGKKQPS